VRHRPCQAAPYHILGVYIGAPSLTWNSTDITVINWISKQIKELLNSLKKNQLTPWSWVLIAKQIAHQEIPSVWWNPSLDCSAHQINRVHTLTFPFIPYSFHCCHLIYSKVCKGHSSLV
jgi:hypothetical protein